MNRLAFLSGAAARRLCTAASFIALLLIATGCGGGESGEGSGEIRIDGSSTVFPLTEAVAEEYMRANPNVSVTVSESGTGGGFAKFLRGETDINDASRPITAGERQRAEEQGIEFIEIPVGYDGIAVVGSPGLDFVDCLSVEELRRIWGPNSDVNNWSQVRDGFPDRSLELYGPGTASGTYDYFTEAIVGESGASRSDFTASEDDNVLVQGVQGTEGALGYFGYAYYKNNAERLTQISIDPDSIDGGASCTPPSTESIQSGSYTPLARPLFVYIRADAAADPVVQRYVNFYLDNASQLAEDVGYVSLAQDAYELAKARFANRTTGTLFGQEDVRAGADVATVLRSASSDAPADTTMDASGTESGDVESDDMESGESASNE